MNGMTIIPDLYLEGDSKQWQNWQASYLDIKTCQDCRKKHGKIYDFSEERYQPEHERCRCSIIPMRTKEAGTATDRSFDGADVWLLYRNRLPDYYVTKEEALAAGWRSKKANLHEVLPGKMIGVTSMKTKEICSLTNAAEFGAKLTLISWTDTETTKEFYTLMMA